MKKEQLMKLLKINEIKSNKKKHNKKKINSKINKNLNRELKNFVPKNNLDAQVNGLLLFT
jgi:hypothetical protein